jgi:hypothetical protein
MAAPADLKKSKTLKTGALSALHIFLIIGVAFEAFSTAVE